MSFSRVLAIDFSAASQPTTGANSLWVASAEIDGPIRTVNLSTRAQLAHLIRTLAHREGRTLIVIDVALGWPAGLADALGVQNREGVVALLDELIVDRDNNANNRFEVANELNRRAGSALWWGHPRGRQYAQLSMTSSPPRALREREFSAKRLIEHHVGGVIKSPMQLYGVGAVGSQSLLAQVMFERLSRSGVDLSVWPFEEPVAKLVVAEHFFSLAPWQRERGRFTDQRQVRSVARWVRNALVADEPLVTLSLVNSLTKSERRVVVCDEGWLMGWRAVRR